MKKKLLVLAIVAFGSLSVSNVFATAGTVNFTGEVLDTSCDVDIGSQNQTVPLGEYSKSEFTSAGYVTAAKKFDIVLKNCPSSVTSAKVRFDGEPDATDSTLLAIDNSLAGAATGVAINLMSADKEQLPLHDEGSYSYTLSSTDDNTLDFYAQYKSTADDVTSGPANSVANFSVIYN